MKSPRTGFDRFVGSSYRRNNPSGLCSLFLRFSSLVLANYADQTKKKLNHHVSHDVMMVKLGWLKNIKFIKKTEPTFWCFYPLVEINSGKIRHTTIMKRKHDARTPQAIYFRQAVMGSTMTTTTKWSSFFPLSLPLRIFRIYLYVKRSFD